MKIAALDLGSNTFLLLICEIQNRKIQKTLIDETCVVRLGQGVGATGRFHPEALQRAEKCFQNYSAIIQQQGVKHIRAVATSAARDAKNKAQFLELAKRYGFTVDIIDGQREAELTYLGSIYDEVEIADPLIIDVGGGSTEIIGNVQGQIKGWSVDVGSVRLTERHISSQPVSREQFLKLKTDAEQAFAAVSSKLPLSVESEVIAVAGTPTTLAQLQLKTEFDETKLHGAILSLEEIENWTEQLSRLSIEDRQKIPGMPAKRADVIVAGGVILASALRILNKTRLRVSIKGVRYGLALSMAEGMS